MGGTQSQRSQVCHDTLYRNNYASGGKRWHTPFDRLVYFHLSDIVHDIDSSCNEKAAAQMKLL